MNDKDLFDMFSNKKSDFDLCNKIEALIKSRVADAVGEENAKFYTVLTKLSNSINNAGWEDRHSEQIAMINAASCEITEKYERYMP